MSSSISGANCAADVANLIPMTEALGIRNSVSAPSAPVLSAPAAAAAAQEQDYDEDGEGRGPFQQQSEALGWLGRYHLDVRSSRIRVSWPGVIRDWCRCRGCRACRGCHR